jgi:hypothetical protein
MFFCKLVPMIKLAAGLLTALFLLAATLFLVMTPGFPEDLPSTASGWIAAWFLLFREPLSAGVILSFSILLAVVAASVTELLLSLVFSLVSALLALFCFLGALGARHPGVAETITQFFR